MFQLKTKRQKAESTKIQWVHFKTLHHERNHQTLQCVGWLYLSILMLKYRRCSFDPSLLTSLMLWQCFHLESRSSTVNQVEP